METTVLFPPQLFVLKTKKENNTVIASFSEGFI